MATVNRLLLDKLAIRQAEKKKHKDYKKEMSLYIAVKNGDFEGIKTLSRSPHCSHQGILSDDDVQNAIFHFIVCVALCARYCIEGGMDIELSYTLSDIYIEKVRNLKDVEDIIDLRYDMVHDYTARMNILRNTNRYSKNVVQIINYVDSHLMSPLSVDIIAEALDLNNTYICRIFKSDTGITIGKYIENQKIDLAKQYLIYSDHSYAEIAGALCYSSQSHFSSSFKKATGFTPREFREKKGGQTQ